MCEIKPKHSAFFRLEVYTSNPYISEKEFMQIVGERLIEAEMRLNEPGDIRVHIHDDPKPNR